MIRPERPCHLSSRFDLQRVLLPMIEVSEATERDYELRAQHFAASGESDSPAFSADCSDLSSFIWFEDAPKSRRSARRIARELARQGFALVYPSDGRVFIEPGRQHVIVVVGGGAAVMAGNGRGVAADGDGDA